MSKIREEARKYALKYANNSLSYFGFLNGAQSEAAKELHQAGMYSEEEVKDLIKKAVEFYFNYNYFPLGTWFNENKKKQ